MLDWLFGTESLAPLEREVRTQVDAIWQTLRSLREDLRTLEARLEVVEAKRPARGAGRSTGSTGR